MSHSPDTQNLFMPALAAYAVDAAERSLLMLDMLRRRGNAYFEQAAKTTPDVLHFESELILDGLSLPRPTAYRLLLILPPPGVALDALKRPFIVFDPRAGQGPGIGGFKQDSEVGLALTSGHPVYFVSFSSVPVKGQTIEDVCAASAAFVKHVIARHPEADKPCLIGNCQAGWQIALMSSIEPSLAGVLILAGAPLSYWAGVRGQSPARYTAGLVGGSWLDAFLSDLGGGFFDGAWLVQAFEQGNPGNTYVSKPYGAYAKIDTDAERFLAFERWWGSSILLTGEEMQFMADELFIGNHLAQGKLHTSDGRRADLRNIRSPIVVFCSRGDDITPPQQALDWLLDIYACDDDIIAREQTIIYAMHDHIGHLGLFVSSAVVSKEHLKFMSNIDMIEALPPGLYEATFIPKSADMPHAELASGEYVMRFERRSLDDIRALGGNDRADDLRFEAVARVSENLHGLYSTFVSPFVRAMVTPQSAELLRQAHPLRLAFALCSDKNPFFAAMPALTASLKTKRHAVDKENPFWTFQETFIKQTTQLITSAAQQSGLGLEKLFEMIYGSPLMQASLGLRVGAYAKAPPERDVYQEEERAQRLAQLLEQIETGGLVEATVRGVLYVTRAEKAVDERAYRMLELLQAKAPLFPSMTRQAYRILARQQYMMLVLDEDRALNAIPILLDREPGRAQEALTLIETMFATIGALTSEEEKRLARLATLFAPAREAPHRRKTD